MLLNQLDIYVPCALTTDYGIQEKKFDHKENLRVMSTSDSIQNIMEHLVKIKLHWKIQQSYFHTSRRRNGFESPERFRK